MNQRHENQRLYWRAAAEQAAQNYAASNRNDDLRFTLLHTLRSWRSLVGCSCCGACASQHVPSVSHADNPAQECKHGIMLDPQ